MISLRGGLAPPSKFGSTWFSNVINTHNLTIKGQDDVVIPIIMSCKRKV